MHSPLPFHHLHNHDPVSFPTVLLYPPVWYTFNFFFFRCRCFNATKRTKRHLTFRLFPSLPLSHLSSHDHPPLLPSDTHTQTKNDERHTMTRRRDDVRGEDLLGLIEDFALDSSHAHAHAHGPQTAHGVHAAHTLQGPSPQAASVMATPSRQHLYKVQPAPQPSPSPAAHHMEQAQHLPSPYTNISTTPLRLDGTPDREWGTPARSSSPILDAQIITSEMKAKLSETTVPEKGRSHKETEELAEVVLKDALSGHFDVLTMKALCEEYPSVLAKLKELERENKALRAEARSKERELYRALNGEEDPEAVALSGGTSERLQKFRKKQNKVPAQTQLAPQGKVATELEETRQRFADLEIRNQKLTHHLSNLMTLNDDYNSLSGEHLLVQQSAEHGEILLEEAFTFSEAALDFFKEFETNYFSVLTLKNKDEETIAELEGLLETANSELDRTQTELQKYLDEHQTELELKTQNIALNGRILEMESSADAMQMEVKRLVLEGVTVGEALATSEGKCEILRHDVAQLSERLEEMSALVSAKETRLAGEMVGLSSRSQDMRKLDDLNEENLDLRLRNEYLSGVVTSKQGTSAQQLRARNETLSEQNRVLQDQLHHNSLQGDEALLSTLQNEISKLNAVLRQEHPSRAAIHGAVDSLTAEHQKLLEHTGRKVSPGRTGRLSPEPDVAVRRRQSSGNLKRESPATTPLSASDRRQRSQTIVSFRKDGRPSHEEYFLGDPSRGSLPQRRRQSLESGHKDSEDDDEDDADERKLLLSHLKKNEALSTPPPPGSETPPAPDTASEKSTSTDQTDPSQSPSQFSTSRPSEEATRESVQMLREADTCLLDVTEPQDPPAHNRSRARTVTGSLSPRGDCNFLSIRRERSFGETTRSLGDSMQYGDMLGRSFVEPIGSPDAMSSPSMLSSPSWRQAPNSPRGAAKNRRMRKRSSTMMAAATDFDLEDDRHDSSLFLTHTSQKELTRRVSSPMANLLATMSNQDDDATIPNSTIQLNSTTLTQELPQSKVYRNLEWHRLLKHYNECIAADEQLRCKQDRAADDDGDVDINDDWLREHTPRCLVFVRQLRERMSRNVASPGSSSPRSPLTILSSDEDEEALSEQVAATEKALSSVCSALMCERELLYGDLQETRGRLIPAIQERLGVISHSHHQNGLESSHLMSLIYALLINPEDEKDAVASPVERGGGVLRQSSTGSLGPMTPLAKPSFSLPTPILTHSSKENPVLITASFATEQKGPGAKVFVNLRSNRCIFIRRPVGREEVSTPSSATNGPAGTRPFFFKIREREFLHLQVIETEVSGVVGEVFLPLVALSGTASGMVCEVVLSLVVGGETKIELKLLIEGAVIMGCECALAGCSHSAWGDVMAAQNAVTDSVNRSIEAESMKCPPTFLIDTVRLLRSDGHCEKLIYDKATSRVQQLTPTSPVHNVTFDSLEVKSVSSDVPDEFVPPARLASEGLESELDATTAQGHLPVEDEECEQTNEEEEEDDRSGSDIRTERQSSNITTKRARRRGTMNTEDSDTPPLLLRTLQEQMRELTDKYDALSSKMDAPPQQDTVPGTPTQQQPNISDILQGTLERTETTLLLHQGYTSLVSHALQRKVERMKVVPEEAAPPTPLQSGVSYVGNVVTATPTKEQNDIRWHTGDDPLLRLDTAPSASSASCQDAAASEASSFVFCASPDAFEPVDNADSTETSLDGEVVMETTGSPVRLSPTALKQHDATQEEERSVRSTPPSESRGKRKGDARRLLEADIEKKGALSRDSSNGSFAHLVSEATTHSRGDKPGCLLAEGLSHRVHGGVVIGPDGEALVLNEGYTRPEAPARRHSLGKMHVSFNEIVTPVLPTPASPMQETVPCSPSYPGEYDQRRIPDDIELDATLCLSNDDAVVTEEDEEMNKTLLSVPSVQSIHSMASHETSDSHTLIVEPTPVTTVRSSGGRGTTITSSVPRTNSFSSPRRRQPPRQLHVAQQLAPLPKSLALFEAVEQFHAQHNERARRARTPPSPALDAKPDVVLSQSLNIEDRGGDAAPTEPARCRSPSIEMRRAATAEPRMPAGHSMMNTVTEYPELEDSTRSCPPAGAARSPRVVKVSLIRVRIPVAFCATDGLEEGDASNLVVGLRMGRGVQYLDCGMLSKVPRVGDTDAAFVETGVPYDAANTSLGMGLEWSARSSPRNSFSGSPLQSPAVAYGVGGILSTHVKKPHPNVPCEVHVYRDNADGARFLVGSGFFVIDADDETRGGKRRKEIHVKIRFVHGIAGAGVFAPDAGQPVKGSDSEASPIASSTSSPRANWSEQQKGEVILVVENVDELDVHGAEARLLGASRTSSIVSALPTEHLGTSLVYVGAAYTKEALGAVQVRDMSVMCALDSAGTPGMVSLPPRAVRTTLAIDDPDKSQDSFPVHVHTYTSEDLEEGVEQEQAVPLDTSGWTRQCTVPVMPTLVPIQRSLSSPRAKAKQTSVACDCTDLVQIAASESTLTNPRVVSIPCGFADSTTEMSLLDSFELSLMTPQPRDDINRELRLFDACVNTTLSGHDIIPQETLLRLTAERDEAVKQADTLCKLLHEAQEGHCTATTDNATLQETNRALQTQLHDVALVRDHLTASKAETAAVQESLRVLESVLEEVCVERDRDTAALTEEVERQEGLLRDADTELAALRGEVDLSRKRLHDADLHRRELSDQLERQHRSKPLRDVSVSSSVLSASPETLHQVRTSIDPPRSMTTLSYSPSTPSEADDFHGTPLRTLPIEVRRPSIVSPGAASETPASATPLGGAADEYTLARRAGVEPAQMGYFRGRFVKLLQEDGALMESVIGSGAIEPVVLPTMSRDGSCQTEELNVGVRCQLSNELRLWRCRMKGLLLQGLLRGWRKW